MGLITSSLKRFLPGKNFHSKHIHMETSGSLDQFKATLRGELIQPGDAKYADSCKVYNGMIHRNPKFIAYCADVTDVKAAVNFGRENNLLIAIRGGGHNGGGLGIV